MNESLRNLEREVEQQKMNNEDLTKELKRVSFSNKNIYIEKTEPRCVREGVGTT